MDTENKIIKSIKLSALGLQVIKSIKLAQFKIAKNKSKPLEYSMWVGENFSIWPLSGAQEKGKIRKTEAKRGE